MISFLIQGILLCNLSKGTGCSSFTQKFRWRRSGRKSWNNSRRFFFIVRDWKFQSETFIFVCHIYRFSVSVTSVSVGHFWLICRFWLNSHRLQWCSLGQMTSTQCLLQQQWKIKWTPWTQNFTSIFEQPVRFCQVMPLCFILRLRKIS